MKGFTYTLTNLLIVGKLSDSAVIRAITRGGINSGLEWRKIIQRSLTQYNKALTFEDQMKLVHITQTIERYCRPFIFEKHKRLLIEKYKELAKPDKTQKLKNMANDLTERTIRKCSY